jgi:heat shock protein HslJ
VQLAVAPVQIAATHQGDTASTLADTDWALISLYGNNLIEGTSITLQFSAGFLGGQMNCNSYGGGPDSGKYIATDEGTLTITQIAVTVQLCSKPDGIMQQEATYIEALQQATTYQVVDDRLEIYSEAGESILVFVRQ